MPFQKKIVSSANGPESAVALLDQPPVQRTLRVGMPGIVYFAPTNRGVNPMAAIITRVGGANGKTLTLTVFGPSGSIQHVTGVSHYTDPSFDLNPERDVNVGSWAFFDEI